MVFLERNVDIGMHVIRVNLLENTMDVGFFVCYCFLFRKLENFPVWKILWMLDFLCAAVSCLESWKIFQFACVIFLINNMLFFRRNGSNAC